MLSSKTISLINIFADVCAAHNHYERICTVYLVMGPSFRDIENGILNFINNAGTVDNLKIVADNDSDEVKAFVHAFNNALVTHSLLEFPLIAKYNLDLATALKRTMRTHDHNYRKQLDTDVSFALARIK